MYFGVVTSDFIRLGRFCGGDIVDNYQNYKLKVFSCNIVLLRLNYYTYHGVTVTHINLLDPSLLNKWLSF